MFISESYINFQENISHYADNDDEFVDISFDLKPFRRHSDADTANVSSEKVKYLSRSADLLYKNKKLNSHHDYDGDTDSDTNDTPVQVASVLARCEICNLEFMHDILDSKDHKVFGVRKRKSKRKRKISSNLTHHKGNPLHCIDFDDYKESNEKMEVFAPDSERKWTLQYQYKGESPMLAKVIIGRGQNDEYPELNNIHLIQELKDYAQTEWRNKFLNSLKYRNKMVMDSFTLIPSVSTCLFCFNERNNEISHNVRNNSQDAFKFPMLILDECMACLDLNESTKSSEDRQSFFNISNNSSQIHGLQIQTLGNTPPRIGKDEPRNGIIDYASVNQVNKSKREVVRTNSASGKYTPILSKREVDIELSDEHENQYSRSPNTHESCKEKSHVGGGKMDGVVNVILMYTDDSQDPPVEAGSHFKNGYQNGTDNTQKNGIINKVTTNYIDNKNENIGNNSSSLENPNKSKSKNEIKIETPRGKGQRKHRRSLSEKLFRRRKSVGKEQSYDDDDDEEFVIIM